ncbi:QLQ domain-containing protein [Trichonephila clavipes]|nr:QLQ domain-containing protein [Trichonephila clavipes]
MAEKRTGRPKILGERSRRTLKKVLKQNRKSLLVEISQEFQSSSGISVSSRTVRRERELKNFGFHGRAAAHKPNITPQNAKHRLQWCSAHRHWTVDMWKTVLWRDESRFTVWQSDRLAWVCGCPANVSLVAALCRLLSWVVEA